jgi:mitogen-activated protein kinase kinase kinase
VVNIEGWKNVEDVMVKALRKGSLNESHVKNYRFYVLDGTEPNPALCRLINDDEVRRICMDPTRLERGRLILRKIHHGEPDEDQIKTAAGIATQQKLQATQNVIIPTSTRSQLKIEKVTGESLAPVSYPLSPASAKERERQYIQQQTVQRANTTPTPSTRIRRMKELFGGRPPSELIASDLLTYFPDFEKDEIDKTVRNSIRRSRRLSRAASRLSTMSNVSLASSLKDAPPLPTISDAWLNGQNQPSRLRPLSVLKLGGGNSSAYRDSITSSVLEPLDEESPLEPDRKSYVSFSGVSDAASSVAVIDPERNSTLKSYYDDAGSSVANSSLSGDGDGDDSLNKRLSQLVHEDSEESDEELTDYLENPSWDNIRYMKGALIGKGSFGSVYLALHAVTGELMAVKQVEIPVEDNGDTVAIEKKKNMLAALKHEIGLLRELKHSNIVQYLGSNSDDSHLNIFLEYVPGGSVATMLVNYGPLGESLISNFVRQILTGLAYLHSKDIIHRDIKGANILVDNKGSVKISDFGISKRVEASSLLSSGPQGGPKGLQRVSLQGSVFWMAPEVVRQTTYTRKADIWSVGCLVVEMFTGSHPHPNCTQLQAIFKIGGSSDASPTVPEGASIDLKEFCRRCFVVDHEKRPSAEELLKSGFCRVDFK